MTDASILILAIPYLAGGFSLLGWLAVREQTANTRSIFLIALLWPLFLLLVPLFALLDRLERRGWYVNVEHRPDLSRFGFRRRPIGTGWAVRSCHWEFQVFKEKK